MNRNTLDIFMWLVSYFVAFQVVVLVGLYNGSTFARRIVDAILHTADRFFIWFQQ